jgi:hypothetical protein
MMIGFKGRWKETAAGLFYLAALFSLGGLQQYYWSHMPQSPEAGSGRTIAVEVSHGRTVYVDATEQKVLYGTYIVLALSSITAVLTWFATRTRNSS